MDHNRLTLNQPVVDTELLPFNWVYEINKIINRKYRDDNTACNTIHAHCPNYCFSNILLSKIISLIDIYYWLLIIWEKWWISTEKFTFFFLYKNMLIWNYFILYLNSSGCRVKQTWSISISTSVIWKKTIKGWRLVVL